MTQKRTNGQKAGLTPKLLQTAAVKYDGSPTAVARALGITHQTADKHLDKPEIKQAVLDARAKALKAAGISRVKAYKKLAAGMEANVVATFEGEARESDAPDYKERREATKIVLQLMGDLKDSNIDDPSRPMILMPVIVVDGRPLKFEVGQ